MILKILVLIYHIRAFTVYSQTWLYAVNTQGTLSWFDIVGVCFIQKFIEANTIQSKKNEKLSDVAEIRNSPCLIWTCLRNVTNWSINVDFQSSKHCIVG